MATEKEVNMHMLMKDLTIDLGADRPGLLAKAFETIAKANINVEGYAEIAGTLHVLRRGGRLNPPAFACREKKRSRSATSKIAPVLPRASFGTSPMPT
jgi:hypothetical protein